MKKIIDTTVQIASNGIENFGLDQMLISGVAGALAFLTANPGVLVGDNVVINMGAYCATQKVHGEDISIAGTTISVYNKVVCGG